MIALALLTIALHTIDVGPHAEAITIFSPRHAPHGWQLWHADNPAATACIWRAFETGECQLPAMTHNHTLYLTPIAAWSCVDGGPLVPRERFQYVHVNYTAQASTRERWFALLSDGSECTYRRTSVVALDTEGITWLWWLIMAPLTLVFGATLATDGAAAWTARKERRE